MKESHSDLKEWRIAKTLELSSKGLSQADIARELQVSEPTVSRDIAYLRQRSKNNISKYVEETLVYEFDKIHTGLELVNKNCWQRYEAATSDKEKYMYLSLAKETYQVKAALLDSGTIIDKAIRFVNNARGLTQRNNQLVIDESTNRTQTQQEEEQVEDKDNNDITES